MATGNRRGKLSRTISIVTNDRDNQNASVQCEAEILSALKCEPETVNLGQVKRSDVRVEQTVKISRGSGGRLNPKVVQTGNPAITAELREIEAGERYELQIVGQPPWPTGMLRANIQLETGVEQAPVESITVFGNIAARAQANPQRFTIRPDTQKDTRLVARLAWDDDHPGQITEVSVNDESLAVGVEEQAGQPVIVLSVPAGYSTARTRGTQVTVKTDDPGVPVLQIPVFVMAAQAGTPGQVGPTPPPARVGEPARTGDPARQMGTRDMLRSRAPDAGGRSVGPASAPAGGAGPR